METLSIKKEAAIAAHMNAKSSGKKLLEDLLGKETFIADIRDRIDDFEDICEEMGKDPYSYVCHTSDQDDIAANALKQALLISRCYNLHRKDKIDWSNGSQPKYCHRYIYDSASGWSLIGVGHWTTRTYCGSRLYFIDKKDAQDAWEKFSDIYIKLIQ